MANNGDPVATGSYGDENGTSWLIYGPSRGDAFGNSRLEEGRGMEEGVLLQEWPRGREGSDWRSAFG